MSEFILYNTEDGKSEIKIILDNESQTIWLNQKQIAELFDLSIKTINEHIINIYKEEELLQDPTIRSFRIVQREGERDIERELTHYNLDLILAVGYRVRSHRGTQFRKWATNTLKEYLVKGFVMNDERLKDPGGWDYCIRNANRGQGLGKQSIDWLTKYLFEKWPQLERIAGTTRVDNSSMRKLFRAAGYVKEGHYRKDWATSNGELYDTVKYSILREDWETGTKTAVNWDDEK